MRHNLLIYYRFAPIRNRRMLSQRLKAYLRLQRHVDRPSRSLHHPLQSTITEQPPSQLCRKLRSQNRGPLQSSPAGISVALLTVPPLRPVGAAMVASGARRHYLNLRAIDLTRVGALAS